MWELSDFRAHAKSEAKWNLLYAGSWEPLTRGELLSKRQGHQQQGEAHCYELDHAVQGKLQAQSFEAGAPAVGQQGI